MEKAGWASGESTQRLAKKASGREDVVSPSVNCEHDGSVIGKGCEDGLHFGLGQDRLLIRYVRMYVHMNAVMLEAMAKEVLLGGSGFGALRGIGARRNVCRGAQAQCHARTKAIPNSTQPQYTKHRPSLKPSTSVPPMPAQHTHKHRHRNSHTPT